MYMLHDRGWVKLAVDQAMPHKCGTLSACPRTDPPGRRQENNIRGCKPVIRLVEITVTRSKFRTLIKARIILLRQLGLGLPNFGDRRLSLFVSASVWEIVGKAASSLLCSRANSELCVPYRSYVKSVTLDDVFLLITHVACFSLSSFRSTIQVFHLCFTWSLYVKGLPNFELVNVIEWQAQPGRMQKRWSKYCCLHHSVQCHRCIYC
ncbi:uncharacterized protein EI90DRAFT_98796 [Cantharellus anzutake]|uniref:uncharacterized protein n=1 Tax=Cantharellus anzutake TaxID=1750568 RepID=UPI001903C036|nr:uncharacterized protein EI90DRAFT_98796 [Cantharellus anzutake]KAF8336996.1 hypothetical protein EI90DRAFT_98796 [Cantharellus anzutake]